MRGPFPLLGVIIIVPGRPRGRAGVELLGELGREHRGAGGGTVDLLELAASVGIGAESAQQQAAVAADDGEHVAEVVGRRELTRRLPPGGIARQGLSVLALLPFEIAPGGGSLPPPACIRLGLRPYGQTGPSPPSMAASTAKPTRRSVRSFMWRTTFSRWSVGGPGLEPVSFDYRHHG